MSAAALSLVPLDAHREPAQAVLMGAVAHRLACLAGGDTGLREPDEARQFLRETRERLPPALVWRNPLRVRRPVEGGGDLLAYRAPPRRAPATRPRRAPLREVPQGEPRPAPIRPAGLRVVAPRKQRPGARPRSLGLRPLSEFERAQLERDEAWLRQEGLLGRPHGEGDADCENIVSAAPCPFLGCPQHLGKDVDETTGALKLNFPDREVWEMSATCAIRVAREHGGGLSQEAVGKLTNVTEEWIRQIELGAMRKMRRRIRGANG